MDPSDPTGHPSTAPSATASPALSDAPVAPTATQRNGPGRTNQARTVCRFYGSAKGCRAGDSCPYVHAPRQRGAHDEPSTTPHQGAKARTEGSTTQRSDVPKGLNPSSLGGVPGSPPNTRQYVPPPVPSSTVVSRPRPRNHAGDPRQFQIQQIKRRFSPVERFEDAGDSFAFALAPSDPDFPFEMTALECVLFVPSNFAKGGEPSLRVKNKEMGKGYQINVERGFDGLVERMPHASLLALMNALDKNLEAFLMERKADTIKIIPNAPGKKAPQPVKTPSAPTMAPESSRPKMDRPRFGDAQRKAAQERRDQETRQLEARLGRLPMFAKNPDGIKYTIPIDPKHHDELPVPLQAVKAVHLIVPLLYPLEPCAIEILGISPEAAINTEKAFVRRAKEKPEVNLMGHVSFLAQNMHQFATEVIDETPSEQPGFLDEHQEPAEDHGGSEQPRNEQSAESSHIIHIPRPPEWTNTEVIDGSDSDFSESDFDTEDGEDDAATPRPDESTATISGPERGISLNFPGVELHGVELLSLSSLSLTMKCLRCKTTSDISNLHPGNPRSLFCSKCAASMTATFRSELVHANATRAGYLDLDGCTVVDMLPSSFVPTCSQCSISITSPGITAVRGDAAAMAICRECHQKLSFKIPEIKFLQVSASVHRGPILRRKAPKESLGIIAGTPLPQKGRCRHYAKSYRWFRFSCCNKVFPCDRCHDDSDASGYHPNEHANRMICGYCSREQNYRPEDCGICRMVLVGKSGSGFWEGGKGTRDKVKMNRHDPRKYKRRGGGAPVGGGK